MALGRFFRFEERGTNARTEILGGATTFMTMAYIIVVNPAILSFAYVDVSVGAITVATILTAVIGSLLMGLYANRPFAVAPYMGENAFIAFGLTALGIGWQQRLGSVFVAGVLFLLLTVLRARSWLANSISPSLKYAFAVGIGLFLTFIGLYQTGIVTSSVAGMTAESLAGPTPGILRAPDVPVKLGNLHQPDVLLAVFGFLLIVALMYRKIHGAMLIGMVVTAAAGYALGIGEAPRAVMAVPFRGEYSLNGLFMEMDVAGVLQLTFLPILLTLFLMSFLDTLGTLVAVGAAGNMLDEQGNFPEMEKPMMVDAVTCMAGAALGSSTSGAFIESATGVQEGARTGLAAVVVALLFAASLFFIPLVEPLQSLRFAYGPPLIAVGVLMIGSVTRIDFHDLTELVPAFVTIVIIIFSYNIANGLTAGLVTYPILKALTGRWRDLNAGSLILAVLCLVYYVWGLPH